MIGEVIENFVIRDLWFDVGFCQLINLKQVTSKISLLAGLCAHENLFLPYQVSLLILNSNTELERIRGPRSVRS